MKGNIFFTMLIIAGLFFTGCSDDDNDYDIIIDPPIEISTVLIKPKKFTMGSPETEVGRGDDELEHKVKLSRNYRISLYAITNKQYAEFLNAVGVGMDGKYKEGKYPDQRLILRTDWGLYYSTSAKKWTYFTNPTSEENYPIVGVTWYGAAEFARWMGGSLPTEAQWEYACRGGTTTAYWFGDDASVFGDYEWNKDNSEGRSSEVGKKKANPWGLYDMHGNLYEWCSDWYGEYTADEVTDPIGLEAGDKRVVRGGSYDSDADDCRSASRDSLTPEEAVNNVGFRIVFN